MTRLSPIGAALLAAGALSAVAGCRGMVGTEPPIRVFDDMDEQPKYKPQSESHFAGFADGRAMRPLPAHTVAQTIFNEPYVSDDALERGIVRPSASSPAWVTRVPESAGKVDEAFLRRGQQRFNIYCAPCHDQSGGGQGMVRQRGFHIPTDLASEHTRGVPDGELFYYISRGVRNMPAYNTQIPVKDRWAIVAWIRVLQRSQYTSPTDVPPGTNVLPETATAANTTGGK